jgi:hypothetical protein
MTRRVRILLAAIVGGMCLTVAGLAWASEAFTVNAYFSPDKLGASSNLSARAVFSSNGSVPTPVSSVVAYGPAGLEVDVRGTGSCEKARLEEDGPSGCPSDSRIGFGGGVGLVELAKEVIKEPFTLELFLAPREAGHLAILIYVSAISPVSLQLVLLARETHGPKPYGFGVSFEVPPIPTLPGASYASVENTYITVGSRNAAYYDTIHGQRRLVHVRGIVVPKKCPRGGFPLEATISFADGSSSVGRYPIPCPHG